MELTKKEKELLRLCLVRFLHWTEEIVPYNYYCPFLETDLLIYDGPHLQKNRNQHLLDWLYSQKVTDIEPHEFYTIKAIFHDGIMLLPEKKGSNFHSPIRWRDKSTSNQLQTINEKRAFAKYILENSLQK